MGRPSKHKSKPGFVGIAALLSAELSRMHGVESVACVHVRSAHGHS